NAVADPPTPWVSVVDIGDGADARRKAHEAKDGTHCDDRQQRFVPPGKANSPVHLCSSMSISAARENCLKKHRRGAEYGEKGSCFDIFCRIRPTLRSLRLGSEFSPFSIAAMQRRALPRFVRGTCAAAQSS